VFSWYGLAPRVYAVAFLNDNRLAQVTDFVQGKAGLVVRASKAQDIAAKWQIGVSDGDTAKQLAESHRWVEGKIVDFGRFRFQNPKWYRRKLRQFVIRYHKKEHTEDIGYHPCPELGIPGVRNIEDRIQRLGWTDKQFDGRAVLDLGCNTGRFCYEALLRGARYVLGVDHRYASENMQLANWFGYWNIDFLQAKLPGEVGKIKIPSGGFQDVICLSMIGHAGGYAKWLPKLCQDVLYFSGQGAEPRDKYERRLKADFAVVDWKGYAADRGLHPTWVCKKRSEADADSNLRGGEALSEAPERHRSDDGGGIDLSGAELRGGDEP